MPSTTRSGRHQKALYWEAVRVSDQGEPKVGSRVELDVRWEKVFREVLDANGNTVATEATVKVDRDIPIDSIFWEGGEEDLPGPGTGDPDSAFYQVVTYEKIPDTKGRRFNRYVTLKRFRDGDLEYA